MFNPNIENITNKIIAEFAKTIELFDLNPPEARLFAYMFLEDKPLTLDDMSDALGKSKTSMSTSIRSLLELNLVTRVWIKGVRKDLYQANTHLFKSFMMTYINKWVDATKHQKEELNEIKDLITEHDGLLNGEDTDINGQLDKIIDFHMQIGDFFQDMK